MTRCVTSSVIGSYPVVIPASELMAQYFAGEPVSWYPYIADAVGDMVEAGIEVVSDGQTRDPFIELFARRLGGCRVRARVEVVGPIVYRGGITVDDAAVVRRIVAFSPAKIVGVLTGPFTLMKSCVDLFYHDERECCLAFAEALRLEAAALSWFVDMVSIDEPWFSIELPEYAEESLGIVSGGLTCPVRLHACGNVSRIVDRLVGMPVDILAHEFKGSPQLFDAFREYPCTKGMCVGSVRSDDVRVESVEEIVEHLRRAESVFGERVVQVSPDCGMRLLPREVAFRKLVHLQRAKEAVYGG
jgi:5-methyltetrahydropteroyltriglutamate--homocysteine methyltransferase